MEIDWNAEKNKLSDPVEYWKPAHGRYKVTFLEDGRKIIKSFDGGQTKKERFSAKVLVEPEQGEKFEAILEVGTNTGYKAAYGQIVLVATENGGLKGLTISLQIVGSKQDKVYIIDEAQPLIAKDKAEKKQKAAIINPAQENF